jgi:hypothetical protein
MTRLVKVEKKGSTSFNNMKKYGEPFQQKNVKKKKKSQMTKKRPNSEPLAGFRPTKRMWMRWMMMCTYLSASLEKGTFTTNSVGEDFGKVIDESGKLIVSEGFHEP